MADTEDSAYQQMLSEMGGPARSGAPQSVVEEAPAQSVDEDAQYKQMLREIKPSSAIQAKPVTPTMAARNTMFQQAGKAPTAEEPELTVGQTLEQAGRNLLPSAGQNLASMYQAVTNPGETIGALGKLGAGVASNIAGAMGVEQDPTKKAEVEALADALGEHYTNIYGGLLHGDTKAFKKAFATDPTSILMDVGSLVGGTGAIAKGLGAAKAGSKLATAAGYIDPIQLSLKAAALPFKGVAKALPYAQAVGTGKTAKSFQIAQQAGKTNDPVLRQAFSEHLTGKADAMEIVNAVEDALSKIKDERSQTYVANMANATSGRLPNLPWNKIENEFSKQYSQTAFTPTGPGISATNAPSFVIQRGARSTMDEIRNAIDWFKNQPYGSSAHNLEGFDALKKAIGEIQSEASRTGNPVALQKATAMYKSVLDTIGAQHPDYLKMMEAYQRASDEILNITQQFGAGRRGLSDASKLSRILSAKNNQTKQALLKELSQYDPRIPYMLAGRELTERLPGGVPAYMAQTILGSAGFGVHPGFFALQAASASPRLSARINQLGGTGSRLLGNATQQAITTPLSYSGRALEQNKMGVSDDDTFNKMLQIESGGSQLNEKGEPITSQKGAIGIAQVMPGTGPEAAKLAGEKWDLNRLKTDEKYNRNLGRAYFNEQLRVFGDPLLAAAAYNAGPGAVRKALELAQKTNEPWVNYLPFETQNYVRMVSGGPRFATGGRIERASGGRVNNVDSLVDDLMGKFRKAKKETDKTTEPLLNAPDEHIVKALDVAQQAI